MHGAKAAAAAAVLAAAAWGAAVRAQEGGAPAPAPPAAAKATVADLAWLAGAWADAGEGRSFEETWLPPSGGTMAAVSREVAKGATRMLELSSIEPDAEGVLWLRVRHFGAGLAPWKSEIPETGKWRLASTGERSVTFEDAARDFPRTIAYSVGKDGALAAVLEGSRGGKPARLAFTLRPAK
jgi:hypothetical protein